MNYNINVNMKVTTTLQALKHISFCKNTCWFELIFPSSSRWVSRYKFATTAVLSLLPTIVRIAACWVALARAGHWVEEIFGGAKNLDAVSAAAAVFVEGLGGPACSGCCSLALAFAMV